MADQNLFEQLKSVLDDFATFLHKNVGPIKQAIDPIVALIPQLKELIDLLIGLLGKLRVEIDKLDVAGTGGLAELSQLTGKIPAFLEAAKKILPGEAASIDSIADVASVVTGLPSVDKLKVEMLALIDGIVRDLNSLKG